MKLKTVIAYFVLSTLLLAGCSFLPAKKQELRSITMEKMAFSFPADAKEIEIPDQGIPVRGFYLDKDRTNFNLVVETLPNPMDLNEYIKLSTAAAEKTGIEYDSKANIKINNVEWNESVGIGKTGLKLDQRTVIHNGKAYIFTYTAIPSNYYRHFQTYENIVASAKFTDR